ncbi:MAG: hypothetical protein COU81_03805 [Candidatus Portnoybacteria bacterium CG10_big_fil_rev_8_21_14_0_10_36_7]|uniref:AI-2E family transporter n=1 Tax=Candidatus Portnoybacteria bacterium CG10_big_fil_rev_8_21_14_0_10_36_7 TaxID=1974812 RepID=A0A2M8KD94_9BACT|nr:MAG: hypothetical protein COU81_03805 [Candidatus Portnoybacteria bacterium CG10_big_fil_rev_8_21_14_0_10_36_7]
MRGETINISTSTIFRIVLVILLFVFLYLIKNILVLLFATLIIAAAMSRPVSWMQKHKIPRILGTIIAYIVVFLAFGLILYLLLPPLASETKSLSENLPTFLSQIQGWFMSVQKYIEPTYTNNDFQFLNQLSNRLAGAATNIFGTTIIIFGGIFSFISILVVSIYLTFQEKALKQFAVSMLPSQYQVYATSIIDRSQVRVGAWVGGQVVLGVVVGVLAFIGLSILHVKYALVLAILAGMLEIVPYIGPVISAVIAALFALLESPILAVWVLILFWVIQQAENYLLVPQIMKKAVGLNPLVVIVAIMVGGELAGFFGILLSVPLAAVLAEVLKDLQKT